jgi:hypothetical protein
MRPLQRALSSQHAVLRLGGGQPDVPGAALQPRAARCGQPRRHQVPARGNLRQRRHVRSCRRGRCTHVHWPQSTRVRAARWRVTHRGLGVAGRQCGPGYTALVGPTHPPGGRGVAFWVGHGQGVLRHVGESKVAQDCAAPRRRVAAALHGVRHGSRTDGPFASTFRRVQPRKCFPVIRCSLTQTCSRKRATVNVMALIVVHPDLEDALERCCSLVVACMTQHARQGRPLRNRGSIGSAL